MISISCTKCDLRDPLGSEVANGDRKEERNLGNDTNDRRSGAPAATATTWRDERVTVRLLRRRRPATSLGPHVDRTLTALGLGMGVHRGRDGIR